jgi:hypothetical protein
MLRKSAHKFAKLPLLFVAPVPHLFQAANPLVPAINERTPPYPSGEIRPCRAMKLEVVQAHLFIHQCDR